MDCPQCAVAFTEKRPPRILPNCGHTHCQECIGKLYSGSAVVCPICSASSECSGPTSFPLNLALIQLARKPSSTNCQKHSKQLEAYCTTDRQVLCISCILDDGHRSHDITSIAKAAEKERDRLRAGAVTAMTLEQQLQRLDEDISSKECLLDNAYKQAYSDYSELFESIKTLLIARETEVLQKLDSILAVEREAFNVKKAANLKHLSNIQELKTEASLMETESDFEVLEKALGREGNVKLACNKVTPAVASRAFAGLTKEAELGVIWKLLRCAVPGKLSGAKVKKEDPVPLALANFVFTKDLRINGKPDELSLFAEEVRTKRPEEKPKPKAQAIKLAASRRHKNRNSTQKPSGQPKADEAEGIDWSDFSPIKVDFSLRDDDAYSTRSIDLASLMRPPAAFIYSIGGVSEMFTNKVDRYDCTTDQWDCASECISARSQFLALAFQDNILAMGGKVNGRLSSSCDQFVRFDNSWVRHKLTLPTARSGFGGVSLGRDIYICGGYDGTQLRSLEMWSSDSWTTLAPMSQKRDELSVTVGPDLHIYAIGGFGDSAILSSCERYNIGEDSWSQIPPLPTPRRALSVVALPDGIYAIGGYDGSKYLKSLDKFDIRKNSWQPLTPMNEARCTLSAVVSPDCQYIYAIGGFSGTPLSSVERYSILDNSWETIAPLPAPKFMHAAVIFSD